tara:strand:- start:385 stop:1182 length:798 start_codon:yes stop_codon:yes gene_type:complete
MDANDGISRDGRQYRSLGMSREIITIQRDRMAGGEALAHKLFSLQNHLDRGFSCSFTSDSAYSWAYPLKSRPEAVDSAIGVGANPFQDMLGSITPQADQYMILETESPTGIKEIREIQSSTVTSGAGGIINVKSPYIQFTYPTSRVFARWYRFWPVLRRPVEDVGKAIVTNEGGRLFSLNLRLVVDIAGLFRFHNCSDGVVRDPDPLPPSDSSNRVPPSQGGAGAGFGPNADWKPDGKWAKVPRPEDINKNSVDENNTGANQLFL